MQDELRANKIAPVEIREEILQGIYPMSRHNKNAKRKRRSRKPSTQPIMPQIPAVVTLGQEMPKPSGPVPPHKVTVFLSHAAVLISLVSLFNSCYQTLQTRKASRLHIRPEVQCVIRHRSQPQPPNESFAPELVLWNNGPIKAVTVSVSYKTFVVDPATFEIRASITLPEDLTGSSILQPELLVGQKIGKVILGTSPMALFVVNTTYYRENDMEKFSREDLFFYDAGTFFDHAKFQTQNGYQTIMKSLEKKLRGEALRPPGTDHQLTAPLPGHSHVVFNFATLNEDGSWTNGIGTNAFTIQRLNDQKDN